MSKTQLHNLIQAFEPISLSEMDDVKLMNRMDTKYALTIDQLLLILPQLTDTYRILEVDGVRFPKYESDYYDNESLGFYIDHHRKKVDRFKVRFRKYVESDMAFLEVKHKNKGRTDKRRIMVKELPEFMSQEQSSFVQSTGVEDVYLEHILTNKFNRITLVGKQNIERLTFDFNLEFEGNNAEVHFNFLVIAELKQERVSRNSAFYQVAKKMLIRPYRLSKYCIGVIELYGKDKIKYNRFKKKLLRINKLKSHVAQI